MDVLLSQTETDDGDPTVDANQPTVQKYRVEYYVVNMSESVG